MAQGVAGEVKRQGRDENGKPGRVEGVLLLLLFGRRHGRARRERLEELRGAAQQALGGAKASALNPVLRLPVMVPHVDEGPR